MNFDLEQELARAARSVHDDAVAERMNSQVRTMVGRIRRRRAARHTAQGVVGIGAVAAVALAGMQLADLPEAPPAGPTTDPTDDAVQTSFGECGSTIGPRSEEPGQELGVTSEMTLEDVVVTDGRGIVRGELILTDLPEGSELVGTPTIVVTRDDVVVAVQGEMSADGDAVAPTVRFSQELVSCEDGVPLPGGEYEVHARQALLGPDGVATAVFPGPWPVTAPPLPPDTGAEETPEGTDEDLTAEEHEALITRNEMMSAPLPNPDGVMPRCGAVAVLDDGSTPLVLDSPLDGGALDVTDGYFQGTITMRTRDGQYVIGNAAGSGATLVLMKEGVVVGYQWLDPEDLTLVDLQPDQTLEIPLRGNDLLCGTGEGGTGPELRLPADTYEAVAVVDVMLKEVGVPGGEAEAVTQTVHVMSDPVQIEISR